MSGVEKEEEEEKEEAAQGPLHGHNGKSSAACFSCPRCSHLVFWNSVQQPTTPEAHQSSGGAEENKVTKVSMAQAAKSCAAGERDESAPHGLFFEVDEGTRPNADWTITLLSAARSRPRKVIHQTVSDLRRNADGVCKDSAGLQRPQGRHVTPCVARARRPTCRSLSKR